MLLSSNCLIAEHDLNIEIYDTKTKQTDSIKYLGTHIDTNVKWTAYISEHCKKISPKVGLLWRLKEILRVKCLAKVK